jgi:dolichol-phosphate mannosyltransferase
MEPLSVSVVLPCYNERGNIALLIQAIHDELNHVPHEIVVVDDNSPDGTFDLVASLSDSRVKVLRRTAEPSLGASIRMGLEAAGGVVLVVMDSDFNHQPKYLPMMIRNIEFYECVSASRFLYGGNMESRFRLYCSWAFNIFLRIITRGYITDSLYGYFAIRRDVAERLNYDRIFWGFGDYCIRLMFYLQRNNVSILQIPAVNGRRLSGRGNTRVLRTLIKYTREAIMLAISSSR